MLFPIFCYVHKIRTLVTGVLNSIFHAGHDKKDPE